jgi:putative thioredoxin
MTDANPPEQNATPAPETGAFGASDFIKNSSTAEFKADVLDASRHQPVLVDFWAPWCGPCKQLTPILEKTVREANGAVRLVKINIDEHPGIAGQLGIQSIPAVLVFQNGQPADGFMGAQPESQVRAFVARLGQAKGARDAAAALQPAQAALEAGDLAGAARAFADVLQIDGRNPDAIGGLTLCYLQAGDLEHAKKTLALAAPEHADKPAISKARAALHLAEQAGDTGDLDALREAVAGNPTDHQARIDLAIALNARGDREEAADQLLSSIKLDRNWNGDAARKQLLEFFDAWGPGDEHTLAGRRKLSAMLFS